ncbi:MAG: hypothetical protein JNM33_09650, partial [Rubrivivax sp.]|nr:hypothetical protein [Rubrivivax sp.]
MERCLVLAVLLHLWAVLMLGSAPGGSAKPGEGVWGSINVTLRGPETKGAAVLPPPLSEPVNGPPGAAPVPRFGGAVRETAPAADTDPGAAQLGRWAAQPAPVPAAVAPLPSTPLAALPTALPVPAAPPPPPGRVIEETVNLPPAPAAQAPLAGPAPLAPPPTSTAATPALAAPIAAPLPEPVLRRLEAAPAAVAPPLPAVTPLATTPTLQAPATTPLPAAAPALAAPPGPAPTAPTPAPLVPGLPDAGSRVGADVATPPSAAASAPPRLNLELARPRGGELSRGGSRGVLPLLPRPPELPDKLARDIEKAAKEDCRKAHAGAGLLAVVPLVG